MEKILLLALFFLLGQAAPLWALQPLVLNPGSAGPPLSNLDHTGYYDRILIAAFAKLEIPITFGRLPSERSLQNVDNGIDDGDFVRIAGLEKSYPNLVMVPEKLDDFEFVAFARDLDLSTNSWDALTPYHVGIVRGWKILEQNLSGVRGLVSVRNQNQLFSLLKDNRVDVVVYSRREGNLLLEKFGLVNVRALEPPLAVRPMYLYLNKKHVDLVAPLADVLKKMKADGIFADIASQTLPASLLNGGHGTHH